MNKLTERIAKIITICSQTMRDIKKNKNRNGTVGSSFMSCVCVGKSWVAQG